MWRRLFPHARCTYHSRTKATIIVYFHFVIPHTYFVEQANKPGPVDSFSLSIECLGKRTITFVLPVAIVSQCREPNNHREKTRADCAKTPNRDEVVLQRNIPFYNDGSSVRQMGHSILTSIHCTKHSR
mmetsp:Transcript_34283/g.79111  ORF Transcript_34283/g.79111 Transcript_34283/m.79111 type:complete len:128 (-) Transcript_34283:1647-2030(-)